MSPKLGWAQIHLGSHSTRFSDLSTGNVQTFGLGAELTPGRFRLALSAGATERAVSVDITTVTRGAFARHMYAGSLGYVSDDTELAINVVRAQDDPASISDVSSLRVIEPDAAAPALRDTISTRHTLMPTSAASTVATISGRFPVTDFLRVSAGARGTTEFSVSGDQLLLFSSGDPTLLKKGTPNPIYLKGSWTDETIDGDALPTGSGMTLSFTLNMLTITGTGTVACSSTFTYFKDLPDAIYLTPLSDECFGTSLDDFSEGTYTVSPTSLTLMFNGMTIVANRE